MIDDLLTEVVNPFPGLRPFDASETYLFFGRDAATRELLRRLQRGRFLAIVGTSGSGKSSLARAGMLPALLGGLMVPPGSTWRIALVRPGDSPVARLAEALASPDVLGREETKGLDAELIETTLRRSSLGLIQAVRQARIDPDAAVLVLVDQFEELFRFHRISHARDGGDEAAAFVALLLEAGRQRELPIYVVLTMRSDFLGDCAIFRGLPEAINDGQYLIPRLTRDQLREAITGPVAVGGAQITPRLLQRLLNDVGDNPDQLPILQHALMRTWERWRAEGGGPDAPVDLPHYEAIGGMADALAKHAEEAYAELSERERDIARRLFQRISERGLDNREIRRPTTVREIAAVAEADPRATIAVIDRFRTDGRTFVTPPAGETLTADSVIDISHESLIRLWDRLRKWVNDESQSAARYRRVADDAVRHEAGEVSLWRDPELSLALNWARDAHPNAAWAERYHGAFASAMRFLEESRRERDRHRFQRRLGVGLLAVAVIVFAGLTFFAFRQWRAAAALRTEAEGQRAEALRERDHAENERKRAEDALGRLEIAVGETRRALDTAQQQRDRASQATARAEVEAQRAIRALAEAKTQRDAAQSQRDLARQQQERAERERQRAETEALNAARSRDEAERQRKAADDERVVAEEQRRAALEQKQVADEQRRAALEQKQAADEQRRAALEQKQVADEQRQRAESLRAIGLARQLAAQADLLQRDAPNRMDLIALLAAESLRQRPLFDNDRILRETLLLSRARASERTMDDPVQAVGWSPDGERIAAATGETTVLVWRRDGQGTPLALRHEHRVRGLAWSPDARRLAVANEDRSVHLWDAASGSEVGRLGHGGAVVAVVWSADGRRIASASRDRAAWLWDAESRREIHKLAHPNPVVAIALSTDGKQLATADESETVRIWNAENGRELLSLPNYGRVDALSWSPDGQRLACGYTSYAIRVWAVPAAKQLGSTLSHQYPITTLAWSPDGQYLASGSNDRTARVWDPESGHELARLAHEDNLTGVTWSPDGRFLATSGLDKRVRVWDVRPADGPVRLVHDAKIQVVAASVDGRLVASASGDGDERTVRAWESGTGRVLFQNQQRERVQALAWSFDTRLLALGTKNGTILVMDATTGQERFRLDHGGPVLAIGWSPDGQRLATAGDNSKPMIVWDLATRQPVARLRHDPRVWDVAWSPDGQRIASGGDDHIVRVWQVASAREVMQARHDNPVFGLDWSRDGLRLASGGGDRSTRIWDVASGAELERLPHRGRSIPLAWSADGTLLVTASGGVVHLWRSTGEELSRIALSGGVRGGLLSADASTLTTISEVGRALVIDQHTLRPEQLLARACARLPRNLSVDEWKEYVGEEAYRKTCPSLP